MAVENIGNLVPTKIPALIDDANIQDALKAYHYGSYDFDTAETDTAELLVPSMAHTINDLQDQIDTKAALEVAARNISSAQNSAPVAANFTAFSETIPNGYIWVDKDAAAPVGYLSATAIYANDEPTENLANGLIWIDKNTDPIEMYAYNSSTSSWDEVNRGPSGTIEVNSPIINNGSNTAAEIELDFNYGLKTTGTSLEVDPDVILPVSYIRSWIGQSTTEFYNIPQWSIAGDTELSNGNIYIYYFNPLFDFTINNFSVACTTASEGASHVRMGLYSVDSGTGTLSLVARTESDTSMFLTANTRYDKPLNTSGGYPSSYSLSAGNKYAFSIILLSQTTNVRLISTGNLYQNILSPSNKNICVVSGETDLLTTISNLSATQVSGGMPWARFT
jgi:hypothetical protein